MTTFRKWKSFDFGPDTSVNSPKMLLKSNESRIIAHKSPILHKINKRRLQQKAFNFFEIVAPKNPSELAVHAKKIQELEGWLKTVSQCNGRKSNTEFLLLTGPTGSGKTTTLKTLCKTLDLDITEWTNPVDIDYELLRGPGQTTKFLEFFNETKYCSLLRGSTSKKVLLIKDFPNAIIRNSEEFSGVLEDIYYMGTHPVVFICTDSCSTDTDLQRLLFPEEVLLKFGITVLSFNTCAPTLLKKGLKRAVDTLRSYPDFFQSPSQNIIDAIVASSTGDIRCAMNQLYLASVIGNHDDLTISKAKSDNRTGFKRKRFENSGTIKHMIKDEFLGLFHGLGRVLNPKIIEENHSWRLNCDIQKLVDEFSTQPTTFTSFLFENYLKYFGDLEDVAKAAEILSFSTRLMENWENHEVLVLALWIAVTGMMVAYRHKVSKWNQIRGPKKRVGKLQSECHELHPTDRFYYNVITKSEKYHKFKMG